MKGCGPSVFQAASFPRGWKPTTGQTTPLPACAAASGIPFLATKPQGAGRRRDAAPPPQARRAGSRKQELRKRKRRLLCRLPIAPVSVPRLAWRRPPAPCPPAPLVLSLTPASASLHPAQTSTGTRNTNLLRRRRVPEVTSARAVPGAGLREGGPA